MNRRSFIKRTLAGVVGLFAVPVVVKAAKLQPVPSSEIPLFAHLRSKGEMPSLPLGVLDVSDLMKEICYMEHGCIRVNGIVAHPDTVIHQVNFNVYAVSGSGELIYAEWECLNLR